MNQQEEQVFPGFNEPTQNWSKLPHQIIENLSLIKSLGELKIILYILRHTWGYHDTEKKITIDEFINGRKQKKDGEIVRIDSGTGMSRNAVRAGIKSAIDHGFIEVHEDSSDKARIKRYYQLRGANSEGQKLTPTSQKLTPKESDSDPRSEKETKEKKLIEIKVDPNLRTLSDYWQTRIGGINGNMADIFKDWLNDYDLGQIMNAIDIAVKENKRGRITTAFVDSIIRRLSAEQAATDPHPLQEPFTELTNLKPPHNGKEAERWHKEFAEIQHISGGLEVAQRYMRLARDELTAAGFSISWPGSLTKTIRRLQSQTNPNNGGHVVAVRY